MLLSLNAQLVRTVDPADAPEDDWAGTQAQPPADALIAVGHLRRIAVVVMARDGDGAVVAGAASVQLVGLVPVLDGTPLVKSAVPEAAATGDALEYDVRGCHSVAVRLVSVDDLDPSVATVQLWAHGVS